MTREEVIVIMGTLQVAYPRFYANISKQQVEMAVNLWTTMLADVTAEQATLAVNKVIATSEWPPTIADIRKAVYETQQGKIKEAGEAWGEVTKAIRAYGYMREQEALESMSEETRTAVVYMGWKTICNSEDLMADRAHFLKIYDTVKQREMEKNQVPVAIRAKIAKNIEMNKPIKELTKSKGGYQICEKTEMEKPKIPEKAAEILKRVFEGKRQEKNI